MSPFSAPPTLFALFVWCYFSRKRQTPLRSGSALLLRSIHACCGVHRVKSNKGRPLFTSGTNHPDGTSINPPPCQQWLECTYVWPWTIQIRQRQIEWGCSGAIFSLARWPFACSRLLSSPHLLLTMCQLLGKCVNFWPFSCSPYCQRHFSPFQLPVWETLHICFSFFFFFSLPQWTLQIKGISSSHSWKAFDFISFSLVNDQYQTYGVVSLHHRSTFTEACFCSCLI